MRTGDPWGPTGLQPRITEVSPCFKLPDDGPLRMKPLPNGTAGHWMRAWNLSPWRPAGKGRVSAFLQPQTRFCTNAEDLMETASFRKGLRGSQDKARAPLPRAGAKTVQRGSFADAPDGKFANVAKGKFTGASQLCSCIITPNSTGAAGALAAPPTCTSHLPCVDPTAAQAPGCHSTPVPILQGPPPPGAVSRAEGHGRGAGLRA